MPSSLNVCVVLSAADLDERYTQPAREFAELLGRAGHTLVWGGSDAGLMKVVADGVREGGGSLVGVSVDFLRAFARDEVNEMVIAADLAERKAMLLARADAVVVMVGGSGRSTRPPTSWNCASIGTTTSRSSSSTRTASTTGS